ncbi:putative defense protein Hdd11 [Periophthalmus magnuspinnatus]|uniref:putative defense protein Hdd11 n=1 Tax=Periophthalmus magnuspinnatus TaxID=409849 RepID=UPI0024372138|nr:putative defense protein Hdd11 [Periophthalmus magnuspinnatus]
MGVLWFGLLLLHLSWVEAYPSGAPTGACEDMMPRHMGVEPQTSPPPYALLTNTRVYGPGSTVTVTIVGPEYRGVLLEARAPGGLSALGTWWLPPPDTRFLECSGNPQGAVTHSNTNIKGNATVFSWTPPDAVGPVYFMATVAQQRTVYWLNLRSAALFRAPASGLGLSSGTEGVAPGGTLLSAALCWLLCKTLL